MGIMNSLNRYFTHFMQKKKKIVCKFRFWVLLPISSCLKWTSTQQIHPSMQLIRLKISCPYEYAFDWIYFYKGYVKCHGAVCSCLHKVYMTDQDWEEMIMFIRFQNKRDEDKGDRGTYLLFKKYKDLFHNYLWDVFILYFRFYLFK